MFELFDGCVIEMNNSASGIIVLLSVAKTVVRNQFIVVARFHYKVKSCPKQFNSGNDSDANFRIFKLAQPTYDQGLACVQMD